MKRSPYNLRNLLLVLFTMSCVIMMLYLFIWVSSSPAMADMSGASHPVTSSDSTQQVAKAAAEQHRDAVAAAAAVHQPLAAAAKQPVDVAGAVAGAGAGRAAGSIAAGAALHAAASNAAEVAGKATALH